MAPASASIVVTHLVADQFEVAIRDHRIRVDQPIGEGGDDTAPTPTELFVSSLATCVTFYVRRYLARHGLSTMGLRAEVDYHFAKRPTRVGTIVLRVHLPDGVPEENLGPLLAVARHCTVHSSLEVPPSIELSLVAAAGGRPAAVDSGTEEPAGDRAPTTRG